MVDRSSTRSAKYQHFILEICCDPETLAERSDAQGMGALNASSHHEELMDLHEQLLKEMWRIIDNKLTKRQKEVLQLYAAGDTQIEIAKKLGVNQSSITKSIHGNVDYGKSGTGTSGKRSYGGAIRKIRKIVQTDSVIQQILKRIDELRED